MSGYLTKIKTKIPYTDKEVDINVDGKTLILTGGNGCGKTQLLSFINQKLTDRVIDKNNNAIEEVLNLIRIYEERIRANGPAHKDYDYWVNSLEKNKKKKKEGVSQTLCNCL
ncbi:hypothetical protein [Psychrobacter immobilis]|uniref:hypothetical protein n=1 Tax=Psychrobacter immobilis TaxID=498 RepID=UPI00191865BA|nr:hypothetical protein [Psychrobacter immobilis]